MKPPPRDASAEVMTKWVNEQLDVMEADYLAGLLQESEQEEARTGLHDRLGASIFLAEHGHIEALRTLLPKLAKNPAEAEDLKYIAARFVNLPIRSGKGDHWPKFPDPVAGAVDTIKHIRALLRQQYGWRKQPSHLTKDFAEGIAAERHGVTVDDIKNRLKHPAKKEGPH